MQSVKPNNIYQQSPNWYNVKMVSLGSSFAENASSKLIIAISEHNHLGAILTCTQPRIYWLTVQAHKSNFTEDKFFCHERIAQGVTSAVV
jgi:hypothetical protein